MINIRKIFEHRNRGLLLDISVFLFQLILIRLLTSLSLDFFHQAEESVFAKISIGLFLVGLFVLQPLGPLLKRWSFHQHFPSFEKDQSGLTGCLLSVYKFFYIGALGIMIFLAYSYFVDAFPDAFSERMENIVVASALVLPIVSASLIFRYFEKPKKPPRWKLLMTPQSEALGDVCMFLNVICFQMLFSVYVSSPQFWNVLHKITRQASVWQLAPTSVTLCPSSKCYSLTTGLLAVGNWSLAIGNLSGIAGRVYVAAIAALLAYFPPRIFYLVIDQHRKITWLMMLLANLPLMLAIVFYTPSANPAKQPRTLRDPSYTVTAAELHEEYEADYQAGMRKYRGQYLNITGRVKTKFFPRSLELDDEIGLDGKDGYPWAYCSFDEDQVEAAEALERDQLVTFQCVGSDNWALGPTFKHCVVLSVR